MNPLWSKISANILAPSQLSAGQVFAMLTPAGRSSQLSRHAASVIMARVQLIAGLFALLVPLGAIVDLLVFDPQTAAKLIGLRILSAAIFLALAWPREPSLNRPYAQALAALLVLLLVPALFHLLVADMLAQAGMTQTQLLVAQLYTYLPTVVLGGLAIFPLTALEIGLLALPVIGLSLGGMLMTESAQALVHYGGTLWFMVMMLGVAMFSGMSQCHYMATLVVRAMQDPLTGCYTRQSGEDALNLHHRLSQLSGKAMSVGFIDIDRFKGINDNFGHEAGDRCLRTFADRMRSGLRGSDILIRWGGEEFVVLLPDTPLENLPVLLQRLRSTGLGERPDGTPVTVSIGIASSHEDHVANSDVLIQRADQRMYAAKQSGRDSVVWPDGSCQRLTPAVAAPAMETQVPESRG